MGYDAVEFVSREVRQYRYDYHAGGDGCKIAYVPIRHVAAQQGHLVAAAETGSEQYSADIFDTFAEVGICHGFALQHRERWAVAVLPDTAVVYFFQRLEFHEEEVI